MSSNFRFDKDVTFTTKIILVGGHVPLDSELPVVTL
jgi:hypothetical protein